MKKVISIMLTLVMICSSFVLPHISVSADNITFKHQNMVGSQTCYGDDTDEKTITEIPAVLQGMRINQPVFRAEGLAASKSYTAVQKLKDGTVIKTDTVTSDSTGKIEFKHARNCEMIEILDGSSVVASLGTEKEYIHGVMITYAPMSWQVYQRDENDKAIITVKGETQTGSETVSVDVDGESEEVTVSDKAFTYTKELSVGNHTITVKSGENIVATYENIAVGDVWVAAGQSNMTDMGAITDGYVPDTSDPINDNMRIMYAEDVTWHKMEHPCGEGRFFKTGIRTSPVTSFAREIAAKEGVPVGIVQSSVGGTNIYQWIDGVRNDANSGYLIDALKSCFDKMPSHSVKGILWYQGCNDAMNETYAYGYKDLQKKLFDAMREFFGTNTPIMTTQINDANQDNTAQLGYYDAWSFVKDVQRQNPDLYDNVYVIGTSDLELGDTIHNSASENLKVGARWAKVAENVVYGDTSVKYGQPTIDTAVVTGKKEITLTFKNTDGLKVKTGTKRIGITNVSGGGVKIALGDLKQEFRVRTGGDKVITASNGATGTELTVANADIRDNTKVVLTTNEDLTGRVAVDCMYGKRFTPTLVDSETDESVLAFFNVLPQDPDGFIEDAPVETEPSNMFGSEYSVIKAFDTKSLSETAIGTTGYKVSTSSSNYNNVVVRDKSSAKEGYYPYGAGLKDNGYYLFFGSGGNSSVSATLTLPQKASAGKYIKITYAKPYATNNGSANRNQDNSADDKITIGNEILDLKANCEFDTWYTSTVKPDSEVSKLDITLGKWGAMAISDIQILDSADTMDFTAEKNLAYITSESQTVQFTASVYNSVTTLMGSKEVITRGGNDTAASVTYSVNGYEGVSIDTNGLLTVSPTARAGKVTVSAAYGGLIKNLTLTLEAAGNADSVKIVGDEMVAKNGALNLKAIPSVGGTVLPERAATWEIVGDTLGCTIDDGTLTAGTKSGNITVKATLKTDGVQTTANVSDTFVVTIKDENVASPYTVKGVFLKNCAADLTTATGVDGVAIDTDTASEGYKIVVKALDKNGITIASASATLDSAPQGVSEIKTPLTFTKAAKIKAYIVNSDNEIVSNEIYETTQTLYKNLPLVSDWITGERSGLGMGKGILKPTGAPYGVNPDTVDVAELNVKYTYDENKPTPTEDNVLWYDEGAYLAQSGSSSNNIYDMHAADWEQKALPIGNGYMGAMLFGLPDKDQIQLNEETFWAAGYRGVQSKTSSTLEVNKKMSEGINGFMSVGNLFVDMNMPKNAQINNYYRDLNLNDAVAHVQYEYDGTKFSREYFASYPKEVVAVRYTADKQNALTFDVNPVSMHPGDVTVKDGEITIVGKLKDSEPYAAGGNAAWNQESDLEYCAKIKVIADGGTVTDGYNTVNVENANAVTILVTAATDYDKGEFDTSVEGKVQYKSTRGVQAAIDKASARMNGAAAVTYEELKAEHIADYKSQFGTVKFTLTDDSEVCKTPTDELQASYGSIVSAVKDSDNVTRVSYDKSAYNALDKHLEELHFNYARYMLISSSRSNTMPATLQGKWCQSTAEIWGSCYCININMEMNYWFAGGANLADSEKSLIYWFKSQIPAGELTAKNYYGVTPKSYALNGHDITFTDSTADKDDVFIMHTKQAIMGTTDLTGSKDIQSAGNTAWLMFNLWDLYQTTGDKTLLKNDIYPIMRKLANFYTQYLYTTQKITTTDTANYPDGYYYTTWEGYSPEHRKDAARKGIKYDLQLVAGMYDYTIAAAEVLGLDSDKVAAWKEIRNHLEKPVEMTDEAADKQVIKEWSDEVTYNKDVSGNTLGEATHRHISHLVGLYPGTLISRDTPDELNAAKNVLINRGDDSTGWACSDRFLLWARTLEGDKALELFRYQLAKKTYSNLFDTHAPFQIDGNFGSAAGVMELLMQSQTGKIYLLPALPSAWDKGEISGIRAKNGAEVSVKWQNGALAEATVKPALDGDITLVYGENEYNIKNAQKGTVYTLSGGEITGAEIELTKNHVTVTGAKGALLVAGYEDGVLQKAEEINGYDADLTGYDGCDTMKAFVWNSLKDMKPILSKTLDLSE